MKLYYGFDSRIDKFQTLEMLKVSMNNSKIYGYEIVFYGESKSIDYLSGYYDYSVDITSCNFKFRDDVKLYIHSNEDIECTTIDSSILLKEPIDLSYSSVWFLERECTEDYSEILEHFYKHGTHYHIDGFKHFSNRFVNTGLIKFNDEHIKEYFINSYHELKSFYSNIVESEEILLEKNWDMCKILSEYYFASLLEENEINSAYLSDCHSFSMYSEKKFI